MESYKNESDDILAIFKNKELIGIGSNGNRIYKAINVQDKIVKNLI